MVLVTSGHDTGSKKVEVLDLSDPTNVCQPSILEDYVDRVEGSSGGLLNNDIALICGGYETLTGKKPISKSQSIYKFEFWLMYCAFSISS
jgi:hypothetical protein